MTGIAVTGTTFDENTWTFTNLGVIRLRVILARKSLAYITLAGAGGIVTSGAGAVITIDGHWRQRHREDVQARCAANCRNVLTITIPAPATGSLRRTCIGLAITASDGSHVATVTLSTGGIGGFDDNQFQREAWITDIFTGPGTVSSTAAVSGSGWSINSHYSYASFVLQATPLRS